MHFYPHHIGDFQRDTASLSDSDTMAYLRLIWMYYDTELPLPNDAKRLAFKIGSNPDSVQIILDTFFIKEQDVYRHKRCDQVLNDIYNKSEQARLAAQIRWANNANAKQTQSERNADALINDADALKIDATHNPIPITHINKYIDRFDEFWKIYPKKVSKESAKKVWLKIKPNDDLIVKITKAVKDQKLSEREQQFIPHAATWLNAKRWEDEVTTTQKPLMGWK
jgi:uncharacterized protein YdaU (DUF1376 family)